MDSPLKCPVVDDQRINVLQETIGDKLAPIVALYFKDCSENLVKLQDLVKHGQCEEVGKLAHQMKGAALSLGLIELQELFRNVEASAKSGNLQPQEWQASIPEALQRAHRVMLARFPETDACSVP